MRTQRLKSMMEQPVVIQLYMCLWSCTRCMAPACGQCACGENLCETCAAFHTCYANLAYGDSLTGTPVESPRSVPEVVSCTGGSGDIIEVSSESNDLYHSVHSVWSKTFGALVRVDQNVFVRVRYMDRLTRVYIYNSSDDEPRQWGAQDDWRKLALEFNWDVAGLVLINISRQRCCVYYSGSPPEFVDIRSALDLLSKNVSIFAFAQRTQGESVEYAHVEVWRHPGEAMRPKRKLIDRTLDRIFKVITERYDVRFYRE